MDTFYSKYIKYKSKYFQLKGYNLDKIKTINTNDTYKSKYIKYKSKYIKENELIGGVLGTTPCPTDFGRFGRSIFKYLRETNCDFDFFYKKIDQSDEMWTKFTWENFLRTNSKHPQQQLEVTDLKARGFPGSYLCRKQFPLLELIEANYTFDELKNDRTCTNGSVVKGLTAKELKDAGYSIDDFKTSYTKWKELKLLFGIWFTITDLLNAGFAAKEIKQIGFTFKDFYNYYNFEKKFGQDFFRIIVDAEFTPDEPKLNEWDIDDVNKLINIIIEHKSKYKLGQLKNFRIDLLIAVGYTISDLLAEGITRERILQEIKYIKYKQDIFIQLKSNNFTIDEIIKADYNKIILIPFLIGCGFSIAEFKQAGYSIYELKSSIPVTNFRIDYEKWKLGDKQLDWFTISDFLNAGFSAVDIKIIGFTFKDFFEEYTRRGKNFIKTIIEAKFTKDNLTSSGFTVTKLKTEGFTKDFYTSKSMGFTIDELITEGFTKEDFTNAGFTIEDFTKADYTIDMLKNFGKSVNV
jgi:hypothetical protein